MLDSDLAKLYGVTTGRLNEQLSRNKERFPEDFAFQLTQQEFTALMSQTAISKSGRGGRRKRPWVFTEQGVAMLSSALRSPTAVRVNIEIMRTFVRLRWRTAKACPKGLCVCAPVGRQLCGIESALGRFLSSLRLQQSMTVDHLPSCIQKSSLP